MVCGMAFISSLMQTNLITVDPNDSVTQAARCMAENSVGAVLLVRDSVLQGVFSERDLLNRVVAVSKDPNATAVVDVATQQVISVEVETPVRKCAELLRENKIRHLAVMEGDKPVGIVSARDFFQLVSSGLERLIEEAGYKDALQEGDDPYDHLGGSYGR